jgi:very-short-patch-repair endonuclease
MEKNEKMTRLSQNLRKNATKEENTLWYQYLRRYPVQFRRQCPFGRYIVDFYCAKALLVVELDGSQHFDTSGQIEDAERTAYLESLGLQVLRFSNTDINRNLRGVCAKIDEVVISRYSAAPLPQGMGRRTYTTFQD